MYHIQDGTEEKYIYSFEQRSRRKRDHLEGISTDEGIIFVQVLNKRVGGMSIMPLGLTPFPQISTSYTNNNNMADMPLCKVRSSFCEFCSGINKTKNFFHDTVKTCIGNSCSPNLNPMWNTVWACRFCQMVTTFKMYFCSPLCDTTLC